MRKALLKINISAFLLRSLLSPMPNAHILNKSSEYSRYFLPGSSSGEGHLL